MGERDVWLPVVRCPLLVSESLDLVGEREADELMELLRGSAMTMSRCAGGGAAVGARMASGCVAEPVREEGIGVARKKNPVSKLA